VDIGARIRDTLPEDTGAIWFAFRINVYGLGLAALWTTLNTILLPERVAATAPESLAGSALGLISFVGIGLAAIVQPIAGRVSDYAPLSDRRLPFVVVGTIGAMPAIALIGWAPTFWLLLAGYVLLQLAENVAQAAFQAFIPDLVREEQHGLASGIKNGLNVLGIALGLGGARGLLALDLGIWLALTYLAAILAATAILTTLWVPRVPPLPVEQRPHGLPDLLDPRPLWHAARRTFRERPVFRLAVIARFLFLLGAYPAQRFLLYFLEDRFGMEHPARQASVGLIAAIALAALSATLAGGVSDRFGRVPVLVGSTVLTAIGLVGIAFAPTIWLVAVAGAPLAAGIGAFQAVNWALLSDHVPDGHGARAFGLANLATAGASAGAGIFGPVVDLMNSLLPAGTYGITFGLAAIATLSSLLILRQIDEHEKSDSDRET
jgi:MFS family permease